MPAETTPAHTPACIATQRVGLIGARGYVGIELLEIIESHPLLDLAYASSRSLASQPIAKHARASFNGGKFERLDPMDIVGREADIVILALPDGAAGPFLEAFDSAAVSPRVLLDLSSDQRFNADWTYGLSEHNRELLRNAIKISNPGCYATAAQLALRPLMPLLAQTPHCFGVSGYSGAGTKRTSRNDHRSLANGVLPYKLVNHTHEREVAHQLGTPVRFSPHVAPYFRGIVLTVQATLRRGTDTEELQGMYESAYAGCGLVEISNEAVPRVQDIVGRDGAVIGGFSVNPQRPEEIAVVCTIDNLRKGAASQAIQNINLAIGYDELTGLSTGHEGDGV